MVTSSTKSSWRQVTSGVIQGSLLVLILFNSFTPDLKWCDRVYLSRFTDDAKLRGAAETPHSCSTMWELNKLENWFKRNLMNFNKGNAKSWRELWRIINAGTICTGDQPAGKKLCRKGHWGPVDNKPITNQQCTFTKEKANIILGNMKYNDQRSKQVILPSIQMVTCVTIWSTAQPGLDCPLQEKCGLNEVSPAQKW